MVTASPVQAELPLLPGPRADTPPACCCCRGRTWMPARRGWARCTWCEGTGIDPESALFAVLTAALASAARPRRAA